VWQLKGKFPNKGYPKIFNDATVGTEAKKLFDDAQKMLRQIIDNKLLKARGVIGFYPANSVHEDIEIYKDENRTEKITTFFGMRQQVESSDADHYLSIGDFVAPKESGVKDYLGLFAVSTGFGVEELKKKFESQSDVYSVIMLDSLADRLAEAFAEKLHEEVRREHWGYIKDEKISLADKLKVKYQGIRPAPGYPSQPDHTEKRTMWNLMKVFESTQIELTESMAMLPAASVSGLYFANKESKYFAVGKITKDQVVSYSARKGMTTEEGEKWCSPILGYEP